MSLFLSFNVANPFFCPYLSVCEYLLSVFIALESEILLGNCARSGGIWLSKAVIEDAYPVQTVELHPRRELLQLLMLAYRVPMPDWELSS